MRGLICPTSVPIRKSERWSILPALTIDGYLDFKIFQGSFTSKIFINFVEQKVLPHCNPRLGPRSVLVLDNASIYRNRRLRELFKAYGVALEFLLPYSTLLISMLLKQHFTISRHGFEGTISKQMILEYTVH